MKRIITIGIMLLALGLAAGAVQAEASAKTPTQTLQTALDELLAILQDPRYDTKDGISEKQLEVLRTTVHKFFDFGELTKRAVGRPWLGFTDRQRDELTGVFTQLLEKTYLRKLNTEYLHELAAFDKSSIRFVDEQIKGNKAMVYTSFQLTEEPLEVNFRLIERDGQWWAYDVIGEGLTLLGIYQDEFKNVLVNQSPDDLIALLQEKIRAIDEKRDEAAGAEAGAAGE